MRQHPFGNLSLKVKVMAISLALFACAIWILAYQISSALRKDMVEQLSKQQYSLVSSVAERVDEAMKLRIDSLSMIAGSITPEILKNKVALQDFLQQRKAIYNMFPLGVIVIGRDGRGIMDYPPLPNRGNADFAQQDFFRETLAQGKAVVSRPAVGRFAKEPRLIVAVPIFGKDKQIEGVFAGVLSLYQDNPFLQIMKAKELGSNGLLVISPRHNTFVSASDKSRILQTLPAPGVNKMHDRYMQGFEGSGIAVNSLGVEELSSARRIPSADWFAVVTLPTDVAFAPIHRMQSHIYLSSAILSVLVSVFLWFFLRREFAPLTRMAEKLNLLSSEDSPLQPLPLEGSAEMLQLQTAFNRLEGQLQEREIELQNRERIYRDMFEKNSAIKLLIDVETGAIVDANPAAAEFYGWSREELRTMHISQINTLHDADLRKNLMNAKTGTQHTFRFRHRLASGAIRIVEVHSGKLEYNGRAVLHSVILDVTAREHAIRRERDRTLILEQLSQGHNLEHILRLIAQKAIVDLPGAYCEILLLTEAHLSIPEASTLPAPLQALLQGLSIHDTPLPASRSLLTGKRTVALDVASSAYPADFKQAMQHSGLHSALSDPILSSQHEVLGCIDLYWTDNTLPDDEILDGLKTFAELARITIEQKRNEENLQLASTVFHSSLDAIIITDPSNRILAVNPAFTQITGYAAYEALGQDPKLLSSGKYDRAFYQTMWENIRKTGRWQGEITNRRKNGELFIEWLTINTVYDEQHNALRHIGIFSDITEKKHTEELIWRQANYDALTGLPNRRLFLDRLTQELKKADREDTPVTLMFIDLDHFKEVNDTLGHEAGDTLLKEAAHRISHCIRETDTLARLGGDEFTIIFPKMADSKRLEEVGDQIIETLCEPFMIADTPAYVSASIGITLYPQDADNLQALLRNADQAMYVAKEQGRNRFSYFTQSMQREAQYRLQLSNDLRSALENGEFELHYQPIIELASGAVHKAEALLRWRHPLRGYVSPAQFIPIAEEIGLINKIGDWAFREAARKAQTWNDALTGKQCAIQISVNNSPRQFAASSASLDMVNHLREIGLPPACIVVEITEGLLMDERPEVTEKLLAFRDAGIQVALDDFGTGYSAMSYLQKFDIDYIKIDQSFVRDMVENPGDQAIAEAIIVMSHKLGIKVIAEGVETQAQRDLLAEAGCDYVQGYFFARPMPGTEFDAYVKNANAS